ncbi:hypothetical protein Q4Q39_07970 [Flavivirga amylovorans]|uniref:Uncharacterized protein n=1 Tax=Flavivirga amylovorans TaxID=870486 RepID=A0ABT8X065_9FLAO|nr:hypothetical protein [Flavivirga amylovorans]MDO5987330.1 hypothetical protein [Flavivirga amylovorans]
MIKILTLKEDDKTQNIDLDIPKEDGNTESQKKGLRFAAECSTPLYQDLNGIQLK